MAPQDGRFTIFAWSAADGMVRAYRVETLLALGLARVGPDQFGLAATYDLGEFAKAVEHAACPARRGRVLLASPERVDREAARLDTHFYCALVQVSDPVTFTDIPEMETRSGLPSAVPR